MDNASDLLWIEDGRQFAFDDLVFWQSAGQQPFERAAAHIDTIVLGPHASAAFPSELKPFVNPELTQRKQCDFSDVLTSTLGRLWAQVDPHTVFVENPHARLAGDANRAPPLDPIADLREFFARLARQSQGIKLSFAGVDAIRPITFSGEPVLQEPRDEAEWAQLALAMQRCMAQGVTPYRAACQRVVDTVLAAGAQRAVRVISLHDTMNTKIHPSGAIVVARPAADRLPAVVNLGNRGDAQGESTDPADPVTIGGAQLRRLAAAWAQALNIAPEHRASSLTLNQPYKGAYETVFFGHQMRPHQRRGSGVIQVEFLREFLMGPTELAALHSPGSHWPAANQQVLGSLAMALAQAGHALRSAA
jgi:N-formylglutamate amidohydrolase